MYGLILLYCKNIVMLPQKKCPFCGKGGDDFLEIALNGTRL